jgi:GT2 family glycosyltransferase
MASPRLKSLSEVNGATAVVVAFDSAEHVAACLEALRLDGVLDIIVVDNNSTDGTVELVRQRFPDVVTHVTHRNLGYGAAANIGIGMASGDPVVVLNADAVIEPGAIEAMRARLEDDRCLGCVSPVHVGNEGHLISPARDFPSIGVAIADGTMLERWLRGSSVFRAYYRKDVPMNLPPHWLDGACLAFRSQALNEVGGFDAGFFMYSEELDLQLSLRQAGWTCAVEEKARVRHAGGASTDRDLVARERHFFRSRYRLAGKMWGRSFAMYLRFLVATINLVRLAEQIAKLPLTRGRSMRVLEARRIARVTVWQWFGWRQ